MNKSSTIGVRPPPDTKFGRVWTIADEISRKTGRQARRKEVMDAVIAEGGSVYTASTEFAHWRINYDLRIAQSGPVNPSSSGSVTIKMGADGRLLIPMKLRSLMMVGEDGLVSIRIENGELRAITPKMELLRRQQQGNANDD